MTSLLKIIRDAASASMKTSYCADIHGVLMDADIFLRELDKAIASYGKTEMEIQHEKAEEHFGNLPDQQYTNFKGRSWEEIKNDLLLKYHYIQDHNGLNECKNCDTNFFELVYEIEKIIDNSPNKPE